MIELQFNVSSARISRVDRSKVSELYASWPRLAEEGARVTVEIPSKEYTRAVYIGMGGSATAGDIISDWLKSRGGPTLEVEKGRFQHLGMQGALVIACSVSGNTRETLEGAKSALQRGATLVSICSGGLLEEFARENGLPTVKIPRGSASRYSLPHLLYSALKVLGRAFEIKGLEEEVNDSIRALSETEREIEVSTPIGRNPSKRLAASIWNSIPKIYGSTITRGVAIRFKNSLNENAKRHAFADSTPELFHNEIEAWDGDSKGFIPVFLRHSREPQIEGRRIDSMIRMLRASSVKTVEERGSGGNPPRELSHPTYPLGVPSFYVAIASGRDPYPTPPLDALKRGAD